MCCRCGEHPARSEEEPFCPICVISIKVEVARGLTQLAGYLGAWAAFGEWCESRQAVLAQIEIAEQISTARRPLRGRFAAQELRPRALLSARRPAQQRGADRA